MKHHLANARSKVGAETTAQLVWILAPRLPEPEAMTQAAFSGLLDGTEPAGPTQQILLQTPVVVALGHRLRSRWPTTAGPRSGCRGAPAARRPSASRQMPAGATGDYPPDGRGASRYAWFASST